MRQRVLFAVVAVCWAILAASAQTVTVHPDIATVETTADGAIHGGALDGISEVLHASGPGDAILIRFRTSLIEKWMVGKAVVAFHIVEGTEPPAEVLISAVGEAWNESSVAPPHLGPGSKVATHPLKDGWVTVELPREIANQLAWGKSASLAISTAEGGHLAIHSRRTGQFMPYLLVRGQRSLFKFP